MRFATSDEARQWAEKNHPDNNIRFSDRPVENGIATLFIEENGMYVTVMPEKIDLLDIMKRTLNKENLAKVIEGINKRLSGETNEQ